MKRGLALFGACALLSSCGSSNGESTSTTATTDKAAAAVSARIAALAKQQAAAEDRKAEAARKARNERREKDVRHTLKVFQQKSRYLIKDVRVDGTDLTYVTSAYPDDDSRSLYENACTALGIADAPGWADRVVIQGPLGDGDAVWTRDSGRCDYSFFQ